MSVMPENEPPHYDTDAVTGNEIYPERDGDHFYIATTDETRIFAKKKDGTPYYARKSTGEEFYPHINGLPVYVYDPDQSVRYALDALGKPVYPKDAQGDEIYVRRKDGRMSIGKNKEENHVYARKNVLLRSESYYPEDGEIGYRKDGTPVYCTRPEQPFVLYPTDAQGNEFYLRGKNSLSDFIHYADDDDPKAILWPVVSYARDRLGNDIYPVRALDGGLTMDVIPVNLNYTRNRNEEYIYPLDEYGNEYTWVDWTVEEHAFPVGYPVTHDGFVIVPNVQNRPFSLPVDVSKEPEVTLSRIVHLLPRQPSTDFLTNVPAVRLSRNVNRGVDYAGEPKRDLTLYVNDAGDTSYTVDPRGNQVYRDTLDVTQLFATRDGKPYYARRADGSEYYPTVDGGHVLLSDAGGKQRYARRRQKEIYPRGRDGRDYVILVQGRPVYATDEEGRAYYPQGGDGKEYLVSMEWIHHNGTVIYPVQNLPPDPSNPTHTNTLISSSHPLKVLRIPYYPWDGTTEQYGRNSDGSYQFLQVPGERHPRYARKLDPSTNQKVEFYPPDHGCIYMGDEPLYALDAQNHPIFPVNGDRDEYYLPHKSLNMEPIHYYVAGNWLPLPRYAKDHKGHETYPLHLIPSNHLLMEGMLRSRTYARTATRKVVYPLDEYSNEYTLNDATLSEAENFPLGYPQTHDNFIIVPARDDKPYWLQTEPPLSAAAHLYTLSRHVSTDFVTDVPCSSRPARIPRFSRVPDYVKGTLYPGKGDTTSNLTILLLIVVLVTCLVVGVLM